MAPQRNDGEARDWMPDWIHTGGSTQVSTNATDDHLDPNHRLDHIRMSDISQGASSTASKIDTSQEFKAFDEVDTGHDDLTDLPEDVLVIERDRDRSVK